MKVCEIITSTPPSRPDDDALHLMMRLAPNFDSAYEERGVHGYTGTFVDSAGEHRGDYFVVRKNRGWHVSYDVPGKAKTIRRVTNDDEEVVDLLNILDKQFRALAPRDSHVNEETEDVGVPDLEDAIAIMMKMAPGVQGRFSDKNEPGFAGSFHAKNGDPSDYFVYWRGGRWRFSYTEPRRPHHDNDQQPREIEVERFDDEDELITRVREIDAEYKRS